MSNRIRQTISSLTKTATALLVCAALTTLPFTAAKTADAHGYEKSGLKIKHPWTRATPPGAKVAGGFLKITNTGKQADKLLGGSFSLSKRVEVHEMSMSDGVMRMKELPKGLEIQPGQTVELKPGSFHLMFMGLSASPKEGKPVKGTLKFEKAGEVEVEFAVAPIGAKSHSDEEGASASSGAGHDHGDHHKHH